MFSGTSGPKRRLVIKQSGEGKENERGGEGKRGVRKRWRRREREGDQLTDPSSER